MKVKTAHRVIAALGRREQLGQTLVALSEEIEGDGENPDVDFSAHVDNYLEADDEVAAAIKEARKS